jgi:hypothetical protein
LRLKCLTNLLLVIVFFNSCKKTEYVSAWVAPAESVRPCNHNPANPVFNFTTNFFNTQYVNYDSAICGIMPLGRNYKWFYRDSVFDNNGHFVRIEHDTLSARGGYQLPGSSSIWWEMRTTSGRSFVPNNLIYITDSVMYTLERSTIYSHNSTYTLFNHETWLRTDNHRIYAQVGMNGDLAYRQRYSFYQTVEVPMGIFPNSILCEKDDFGYFRQRIYFNTSVGILRREYYDMPSNGPFNFFDYRPSLLRRVSELVKFTQ